MTTKLEQAARQALKALEVSTDWDVGAKGKQLQSMKAITALREALAEQAGEEGKITDYMLGFSDGRNYAHIYEQTEQKPVLCVECGQPTMHMGNKCYSCCQKATKELEDALKASAPVQQAEQEPVAWRVRGYNQFKTGNPVPWRYVDGADKPAVNKPDCCDFEPLYAAPVRTKDLTDDEVAKAYLECEGDVITCCRAVIAADREKNNPLTKSNKGE